ncbi:MAG: 30S ribosomal protein S16 [Chloroflexota bacterium]|jgi:small subunit ribosomal protein S16
MLRIRLSRTGKKRQPSYRVVVAEREAKRDGRVVERIGFYNPLSEPVEFQIQEARALYWLSVGAQPSDAVRILLEKQGTYERLVRVRSGESIENLVAEFQGTPAAIAEAGKSPEAVEAAAAVAAIEAATLVVDEEE